MYLLVLVFGLLYLIIFYQPAEEFSIHSYLFFIKKINKEKERAKQTHF